MVRKLDFVLSEKIMLKQRDEIVTGCRSIGSRFPTVFLQP
jgi:hypothetical protein